MIRGNKLGLSGNVKIISSFRRWLVGHQLYSMEMRRGGHNGNRYLGLEAATAEEVHAMRDRVLGAPGIAEVDVA
jgi:hypothetical protein